MFRLREAADALRAAVRGPDAPVTGVTTDSRAVAPGDLFVALEGERFDGHRFADAALAAGAAAVMVREPAAVVTPGAPVLVVPDTRAGLGQLAAWWRGRFVLPVVGVTGSNGKTTVKELTAAILREHAGPEAVLATRGNLNNDIGLPLMLLSLRAGHRHAVLEMGMNHLGEIRYLAGLARPSVAVINNAGTAHIGELGSRENIARAKGEIFEGLAEEGTRILNADDAFLPYWSGLRGNTRVLLFGLDHAADVTAGVEAVEGGSLLRLRTPAGEVAARLHLPGLHNVRNALAAAAVATTLGVPLSAIARGLDVCRGVQGRLQASPGPDGSVVVDDTYNANPDSTRAAIDWLARAEGRRILVLGDMGELGAGGEALHAEVGTHARESGLDGFYALGDLARHSATAFGPGARHYDDVDALLQELRGVCAPHTTLLVKGSRFMRMERVVRGLATGGVGAGEH